MIEKIILTNQEPKFTINNPTVLKKLIVKSANSVEGVFCTDVTPFLELKLKNESQVVNLRMNLIPSTNHYDCFDLLESADQIPALKNVGFNLLEISIPENQYEGEFKVIIETEAK
jgi:hypothetical protein